MPERLYRASSFFFFHARVVLSGIHKAFKNRIPVYFLPELQAKNNSRMFVSILGRSGF